MNFLQSCSFELLQVAKSARLNSKASLSKTNEASNNLKTSFVRLFRITAFEKIGIFKETPTSKYCYSNIADVYVFNLSKCDSTNDIFPGMFQLLLGHLFKASLKDGLWRLVICIASLYSCTFFVAVSLKAHYMLSNSLSVDYLRHCFMLKTF